jgi:hypothetical protein
MTDFAAALAEFDRALGAAMRPDVAFDALHALTPATVGVRLFTIMTVDMQHMLARAPTPATRRITPAPAPSEWK